MGSSETPIPPPLPPPLPGEVAGVPPAPPLPPSPQLLPAGRSAARAKSGSSIKRAAQSERFTPAAAPRRDNAPREKTARREPSLWAEWIAALQAHVQFKLSSAPPWLVSGILHMLVLIVLAMITIAHETMKPDLELSIVPVSDIGEQLIDATAVMDLPTTSDHLDLTTLDTTPVVDPFAAPPDLAISPEGLALSSDLLTPDIGNLLNGRNEGTKQALLGRYGGTQITEEAVGAALEWLKRQQRSNGSWSLKGPYPDGSYDENEVAATAMALLAFQGAGNTHQRGQYKEQVDRGWKFLLKTQTADGDFKPSSSLHNHRLYTHAQVTIAVCELYGMTKDSRFLRPAERAIQFCVRSQSDKGGWRYQPTVDSDLSVTGWFVMALQSARMAGLNVPKDTLSKVGYFLDSVQSEDGAKYSYVPHQGATLAMTAEGLLCRQYLGWTADNKALKQGVAHLVANPIQYNRNPDVYYWYYATQVVHHVGGKPWHEWNKVMSVALPAKQVSTGPQRGSWDPASDAWATAGRLYVTCLSVYMLEVYYRHLPLYKSPHISEFEQASAGE